MGRLPLHKSLGVAFVAVVIVAALSAAGYLSLEAFEERDAAAKAVDLQVATLNVSALEVTSPEQPDLDDVVKWGWITKLRSPADDALHSLTEDEAEEARLQLAEIADHGAMVLRGVAVTEEEHQHERLQTLLALAADRSAKDAITARRQAYAAIALALAAVTALGVELLRRRFRRQAVAESQRTQVREGQRLQRLLNDSPDIFMVLDPGGASTYQSASAARLVGRTSGSLPSIEDLVCRAHEQDRARLRNHLVASDASGEPEVFELADLEGETGWFAVRVSDLTDDELVAGHLVTVSEISREVELRNELRSQAQTDHLTGLSNRRTLDSSLERARQAANTSKSLIAFATLDLDGFKEINDSLGHQAGDEMLIKATQRLTLALPPDDILLRLGGDEFGVVMIGVQNETDALNRSRVLLSVFDEPFKIQNQRLEPLRASIGVAIAEPSHTGVDLVSHADVAMYQAKRTGGSAVVAFEPAMEDEATLTANVTRALRSADYDQEFHLVFQPIVDSKTLEVVSLEALLRWDSPLVGRVGPDRFIPLAETSGEICHIGEWVLNAVCAQLSAWIDQGLDDNVTMSFNVSARQLTDAQFVPEVFKTVAAWNLDPARLVIEVTESSVIDDNGVAIGRLGELRARGFKVSIDDFGSGYSNLGQLLHVPFDIIKVDRSLLVTLSEMREMHGGDPTDACSIMQAVVSIAGVLGAPVVCEGVETEAQRTSLISSGITYLQGYHTGRPSPAEQTESVLGLGPVSQRGTQVEDRLAA